MNQQQKAETGGGVFLAIFLVSLVLLIALIWSPAAYYLGKWSGYWDSKNNVTTVSTEEDVAEQDRTNAAFDDCNQRIKKYFEAPVVDALALSSDKYKHYECYGFKYTQVK